MYAGGGDRRKLQSLHRAYLAIIADHRDRRISPSVSPALWNKHVALILHNLFDTNFIYFKRLSLAIMKHFDLPHLPRQSYKMVNFVVYWNLSN